MKDKVILVGGFNEIIELCERCNKNIVGIMDNVREALKDKGIQTSVHYPAAHRFSIYKRNKKKLPVTEYVTDN